MESIVTGITCYFGKGSQSEARKQRLLASDGLKLGTLPGKYRSLTVLYLKQPLEAKIKVFYSRRFQKIIYTTRDILKNRYFSEKLCF